MGGNKEGEVRVLKGGTMSTDNIGELVECLTLKDGVSGDVGEWQQGNRNST